MAHQLMGLMIKKAASFSNVSHKALGNESVFFGTIHSGDFFNRIPTECKISGTRRYLPGRTFVDIEKEFSEYLDELDLPKALTIDYDMVNASEPYELDPNEKIIQCLKTAYQTVTGKALPLGGVKFVGEAALFINTVGVPTLYHGVDGKTIHCDEEFVEVDDIVRVVKTFIHTIFSYFE
jgi:acetylornithine deacetylase/succinyl-diaminopimelate desuccinylase-like protein